jgi:hypothetical protein
MRFKRIRVPGQEEIDLTAVVDDATRLGDVLRKAAT